MKIPARGFTHAGKFHADDEFATALLQILRPDIQVTRGFVVPDHFDGIVYDIGDGMFDHHREPRQTRANGVPYAAFGLLWRVLGPGLVGERQARLIDETFVQPLDLNDNTGEPNSLCDAIGFFNPAWDSADSADSRFFEAVAVAKQILTRQIEAANAVNRADEKVRAAYAASRDGIVVLPCYLPWKNGLYKTDALFVVYPSQRGGWSAQCVTDHRTKKPKLPFPASWAGQPQEVIEARSGLAGISFCHASRFLITAAAKHTAAAACRLGRAGGDPQQLQGPAVHHQTVAAGPHRADRDLGGDGVQVVPVGHPAGVREQVLVPAAADQPGVPLAGVPGQEGAHTLQHLRKAAGVLRQLGHLKQIAVFHQVHMAVVEAAADKLAAQVHQFVPGAALGQGTGVRARKGEAAVLDDKSLGQRQRAGVDRAVVIDRFHGFSPALWVGSFGVIIAAPGPKVNALGAERKKMFQDIDTMSELWYSVDTDIMSE